MSQHKTEALIRQNWSKHTPPPIMENSIIFFLILPKHLINVSTYSLSNFTLYFMSLTPADLRLSLCMDLWVKWVLPFDDRFYCTLFRSAPGPRDQFEVSMEWSDWKETADRVTNPRYLQDHNIIKDMTKCLIVSTSQNRNNLALQMTLSSVLI